MTTSEVLKEAGAGNILVNAAMLGLGANALHKFYKGYDAMPKGEDKEYLDRGHLKDSPTMQRGDIKALAKEMGLKRRVLIAQTPRQAYHVLKTHKFDKAEALAASKYLDKDFFSDKSTNAGYVSRNADMSYPEHHTLLLPKSVSGSVVAHELGHAKNKELYGHEGAPPIPRHAAKRVLDIFTGNHYNTVVHPEEGGAWAHVPARLANKRLEELALRTYRGGAYIQAAGASVGAGLALHVARNLGNDIAADGRSAARALLRRIH